MVYRSEISNTLGRTILQTGCCDITQWPNHSEPASAIRHTNVVSPAPFASFPLAPTQIPSNYQRGGKKVPA